MGIISWIIFGLIAGILAKWIMPGKDGGGFFMTIILGVVGAVVGGGSAHFSDLAKLTVSTLAVLSSPLLVPLLFCLSTEKSKAKRSISQDKKATDGGLYYFS